MSIQETTIPSESVLSFDRFRVGATPQAWSPNHRAAALRRLAIYFLAAALLTLHWTGAARAQSRAPDNGSEMQAPTMLVASQQGGSAQLPLVSERLDVKIDQGHATTTFAHSFQNESMEVLEGRYQISLGSVATATGFSYMNGSDKVVGEIFEKEAATRVYATVTGQGRDPGLLEQTGEGQFSFRVAPIAAGETKKVSVTTAQWLRQTGNMIEYSAPLAKSGKSVSVSIQDSRTLKKLWSPTHEIQVKMTSTGATVNFLKPYKKTPDRLTLRYQIKENDFSLSTALHQSPGQDAYLVVSVATPESFKQKRVERDVTIVIDRSGSMTGSPLEAARKTTLGLLARLHEDDRVNIVTFDDGASSLFDAPQRVSHARAEAEAAVSALTSGGGTDLALALQTAFSHQNQDERPRFVLFLTDGQSNPQAALEAARISAAGVRLYTVGIGTGVDRALLSRLAREHRGRFTYVADESRLERDVERVFSRIVNPSLSELSLSVDGARMQQMYPRQAPDLFEKDQITFALRLKKHSSGGSAELRLMGKSQGKVRTLKKRISLKPSHRPWVGRMWAQNRVDDLLEQMSLNGETPELKNETLELALAYDLVTRYTSFLAIPESEITEEVRGTIEEERARRAQILSKHKDAAALSRTIMPPGDPVLSIRAPHDAQGVTAVFTFGLTLELRYSPKREFWEGRFLVPNHVADGNYATQIFVTDRNGLLSQTSTDYEIDSQAPAFTVGRTIEKDGVRLVVEGDEALREVRLVKLAPLSEDESGRPTDLKTASREFAFTSESPERFILKLNLSPGVHHLRIVVTDLARNESVRIIKVHIDEKGHLS